MSMHLASPANPLGGPTPPWSNATQAALDGERAEAERLAQIQRFNRNPLVHLAMLGGPLLFGAVAGIGTAWAAAEVGFYKQLTDGVWLIGLFYVVGLGLAAGIYFQKIRRHTLRPQGVVMAWPASIVGPAGSYATVVPSTGAPPTGAPPPAVDAAWRAARLANIREERRQATLGGEPIGLSWSAPLARAWSLCLAGLVFPGFATLLVAVGGSSRDGVSTGAIGMTVGFWALWSLTIVLIVRATQQRRRLQRQRAEVDELARRIGWPVGQGVFATVRWLDAFWEAPFDHRLLQGAPHQWALWGTFQGFPLLFDLSPFGARWAVPRFIAALAAYPPPGPGATSWLGAGPTPPTPQLAWLRELGLRLEHSEAGLLAVGDAGFVRDFELDPGSVPRLVEIARVMVEHAQALGAAPRSQLP